MTAADLPQFESLMRAICAHNREKFDDDYCAVWYKSLKDDPFDLINDVAIKLMQTTFPVKLNHMWIEIQKFRPIKACSPVTPPEPTEEERAYLDKFKKPDGTLDVAALLQSIVNSFKVDG